MLTVLRGDLANFVVEISNLVIDSSHIIYSQVFLYSKLGITTRNPFIFVYKNVNALRVDTT